MGSFWSRVRESNPPPRLGKPLYYRCTNPAYLLFIILCARPYFNASFYTVFLCPPDRTDRRDRDTAGSVCLRNPPAFLLRSAAVLFLRGAQHGHSQYRYQECRHHPFQFFHDINSPSLPLIFRYACRFIPAVCRRKISTDAG